MPQDAVGCRGCGAVGGAWLGWVRVWFVMLLFDEQGVGEGLFWRREEGLCVRARGTHPPGLGPLLPLEWVGEGGVCVWCRGHGMRECECVVPLRYGVWVGVGGWVADP